MAFDFVGEGFLDAFEGIEVFDFDFGAEGGRTGWAEANVGIAAETAFFHVAVADGEIGHEEAEGGEIGVGLIWGEDFWGADNFEEGCAGAIQIDKRSTGDVDKFAGVFFEVNAGDADAAGGAVELDIKVAV